MTLTWLPASSAHGARDFEFSGSVRRVTGAVWQPANTGATTPIMLMGHGASGDRYQAPIPYLAERFVAAGVAVIAIDGPVHGLRQVGPGGRVAFGQEMAREGFQDDMVADWHDALKLVRGDTGLTDGRVGYFGLSMGTLLGLPLLASDVTFTVGVVGLCGTTGAGESCAERLRRDAGEVHHPVLFLMQLEDELFPRDGYLDLFDALASTDKRLHANPGLHPEVPAEEVDFAFDFLLARLVGDVPRRVMNPLAE